MSRKVIGLDIRNDCLNAALLSSSLREHRLEDFIHLPFSGPDEPERSLSSALVTLTEKMDLSGSDWIVSIPANRFVLRNLKIPFGNSKKIRMVLPFELEPTLPHAMENLVIDFHILNGAPAGDQTELIAAAIEKSQLAPYIEALASISVDPEKLTLGGLPAALCLANRAEQQEDQLYIDVDNDYGTLFILVSGRLHLIRSFPLPRTGPSKVKMLCMQTQQTLAAFHESSGLNYQPLEAAVSGIGMDGGQMAAEMSTALNLPVKPAALADRLNIPVGNDTQSALNPAQLDNSLALALMAVEGYESLNFHKGQFAAQKFLTKYKRPLIKTAVLAAAVLVLMFFNLALQTYALNRQVHQLDAQMEQIFKSTFPEVKTVHHPYPEMQAMMRDTNKNAVLQTETGPHIRSIDILNSISEKIPETITVNFNRMVIQPEDVIISGTTDTFNSVDDIKSRLEQIQFFQKVTISSANIDRSGNEVQFMLKAEFPKS
jgi:general secretion pathway protein L